MSEQTVDVRILSPSSEAEVGLSFSALPTTTTVRELKAKIKDALPSHPATERMRIIYLGRMALDDTSLATVLGREIQQARVYNLHMVLSESPPPTARSSTAPPNPLRTMPPPNNVPGVRAAQIHRPQSQPPRADRMQIPGMPVRQGPLQQPMVNYPPHMLLPVPIHDPALLQSITREEYVALQQYQMNLLEQERADREMEARERAAREMAARGLQQAGAANNADHGPNGHFQQAAQQPGQTNPTQTQTRPTRFVPGNRTSFTQGGIGPNGERWTVSVNNNTMAFPHPQPILGLPQMPLPMMPIHPRPAVGVFESASPFNPADGRRVMPQVYSNLEAAENQVRTINNILAPHNVSREEVWRMPTSQFQQAAIEIERLNIHLNSIEHMLNALIANPLYSRNRELVTLQMDNENMRNSTRNLVRILGHHITARRHEWHSSRDSQGPSPPAAQMENAATSASASASAQGGIAPTTDSTSANTSFTRQANNIFLLSSPNGPHAVLYSPEGTYTAPTVPPLAELWAENLAYQHALSDVARRMPPATLTGRQPAQQQNAAPAGLGPQGPGAPIPGNQAEENPAVNGWMAEMQPQLQQQIQAQQAPQQGQMVVAAAIATHFWLLLRIFGMLWFFGGSGWRRTLMLSICGLAIYIFQAGFLGERFLGNPWNRVRRHFEALVGIPQQAPAEPVNNNNNNDNEANANMRRGRRREPSPEDVAQRLLQQREERGRTWLRQTARSVERSLALFVASLWPGLGERMVAAREEAEAQARRDAQDREERERAAAEAEAQAQAQTQEHEAAKSGEETQEGPESRKAAEDESQAKPHGVSEDGSSDKLDKGKGKAVDGGEASSSSTAVPGADGGASDGSAARQRDAWSSGDLD